MELNPLTASVGCGSATAQVRTAAGSEGMPMSGGDIMLARPQVVRIHARNVKNI